MDIDADAPRTQRVMDLIVQRVDRRSLTPGARVPSVRAMAQSCGVSKSTVVEAYDRLAAQGVIRSRPGSGFFVMAPLAPLALDRVGPQIEREVDPLWMLRQSLVSQPNALMPGCGWLPETWMAEDAVRKGLRTAARQGSAAVLTGYGSPLGSEPMRILVARRLAEQGVEAAPDQILLTDNGTQALDLVCRFLIQPGDTVLVDDPCYFNFHALLRAHRAHVVGVTMTPTGPDVQSLEAALLAHRPRLYLTNSAIHNPTGATLAAATAHRMLKLAEAHDLIIVEDDVYADFEHEPSPRLAAFDGLERVIRVGSLSKSLSASVRCGHIAARPDWIEALTDLRIATSLSGNPLACEVLHTVLTDGSYKRHMEKVRVRLSAAMARTLRRVRAVGMTPWIEPQAGIFLWARLPHGIDAADLAREALRQNIILAPGRVFSLTNDWSSYLRFNVAVCDDERIFAFLEQARQEADPESETTGHADTTH